MLQRVKVVARQGLEEFVSGLALGIWPTRCSPAIQPRGTGIGNRDKVVGHVERRLNKLDELLLSPERVVVGGIENLLNVLINVGGEHGISNKPRDLIWAANDIPEVLGAGGIKLGGVV